MLSRFDSCSRTSTSTATALLGVRLNNRPLEEVLQQFVQMKREELERVKTGTQ